MQYVSPADWTIILLYLAGIIGLGIYLGRGQRTTRDYFLGSRNIPWWGVGLSIVATETSALTFIGVPAFAYGSDLTFIQIIIGYVIARVVLAVVMVPHYFRGEIYSPYELIARTFGDPARRTAGAFFLINGTLAAGVRVYVTCIPIQLMFGFRDDQIIWAILMFVGLSLIYTYVGGIKAVVWTDAVQFFLFTAGGLFVLCYIPTQLDGGLSDVIREAGTAGKLHWLNPEFSLQMPYNLWMGIIGATFLVMSSHGVDQLIVQRVLSCRDVREGRKALVLSAVIILPLFLLFLLVGVFLWAYYQHHSLLIEVPELRPGVTKDDYLFPVFMLTETPVAIKGLLIVGVLSAAMSSVSSALAALASVSTMDFLKLWIGERRDERFYFRISKHSTLFWAAVLTLVAWLSQQAASILELAFSLNGLTSGAMLAAVGLALFTRKGQSLPVIIALLVSLVGMCLIQFTEIPLAWPWFTLTGLIIALLAYGCAQLFFPRPKNG